MRQILMLCAVVAATSPLAAQIPQRHFSEGVETRFSVTQPVIHYLISVAEGDTTGYDVQMVVSNAPDTFRVALAKHPEYDDRFFRHVTSLRGLPEATTIVSPVDSNVWRVSTDSGKAVIAYRIELPPRESQRAAWRPFLTPHGGLIGGIQSFMYMPGHELAPAHVEISTPWPNISTGLTPTSTPTIYFAPNAYVLVESPILVGRFPAWSFTLDRVPHTIAYFGRPGRPAFDTTAFRDNVEKLALAAVELFGRPPYREYIFQFQDEAYGGLEHHNSVTLGAPADQLRQDPGAVLDETAHEFIHTWNLMRIRPAEYVGVTHRDIRPVPILWFSEGLTIFYSDLLRRRAGLRVDEPTRIDHLASLYTRYLRQPGNARFSAEQISRVEYNSPPDALGDYNASSHTVGELLGALLDIQIRDATDGAKSMDDVMRLLMERVGTRGVAPADIEKAVADVCKCVVKPFFDAHVRGARAIDVDRYIGLLGLEAKTTTDTAVSNGSPSVDLRIWAWTAPGDSLLSLLLNTPESVWGRAGLKAGDRLISINGTSIRTWENFRRALSRARVGDILHVVVMPKRATEAKVVSVTVGSYTQPTVSITPKDDATEKQLRLRSQWLSGR